MSKLREFALHCCALDAECRGDIGWCWRVHLNTPWWHVGVALRRSDRYANADGTADWVTCRRW